MNRTDFFLICGALAVGVAAVTYAQHASEERRKSAPPSYVFCTVDDNPTFVIPSALGLHFDEAGVMHARDEDGTRYAYALRPGEACQITPPEGLPND